METPVRQSLLIEPERLLTGNPAALDGVWFLAAEQTTMKLRFTIRKMKTHGEDVRGHEDPLFVQLLDFRLSTFDIRLLTIFPG